MAALRNKTALVTGVENRYCTHNLQNLPIPSRVFGLPEVIAETLAANGGDLQMQPHILITTAKIVRSFLTGMKLEQDGYVPGSYSQTLAKRSAGLRQADHRVCSYPVFHVRLQSRPCLPLRKLAMADRDYNNTGTRIQAEDVVCII